MKKVFAKRGEEREGGSLGIAATEGRVGTYLKSKVIYSKPDLR